MQGRVTAGETRTFPEFLDRAYPDIERGEGVWLYTTGSGPSTEGRKILDACSGGAMVSCLGSGVQPVIDAAARQAEILPYYYDEQFTNRPKEELADRLISVAAPEMGRVRFVSSGSEANEMALRLARAYHVDRGQPDRWQVISPAQSYHGATMATIALSGRPSIQGPYEPYLSTHPHIPPATWRYDATGETALKELDQALEDVGPETVSAFFIEPVSALSLPAYSPPQKFWEGLAERRERYGFLVVFDEVVTGIGRTGSWFAYQQLPIVPDIVTTGKGLGAGYFPVGAMLCRREVYDALAEGSRSFDLGHTWDGAPLPCAVGLAVLDVLSQRKLVDRVRDRGPSLCDELASAISGSDIVHDVRGRGFLLGVEVVDPRDGSSFLPADLHAAYMVEDQAFENGLLVRGTHSGSDEYTRDEVLLAPAYTSSDEELATMVERFAQTISQVEHSIKESLAGTPVGV